MHFSQLKQNQPIQNSSPVAMLTNQIQLDKRAQQKQAHQRSKTKNDNLNFLIDLMRRVQKLEKHLDVLQSKGEQIIRKKKKLRRKARDVPKMYKCNMGNCQRQYGSITSLKNHRKLKHGLRISRKSANTEQIQMKAQYQ